MVNFDRTQSNFIDKKIRETIEKQRPGKVLTVYEHLEKDDDSNFEADVKIDGGTRLEQLSPVIHPSSDSIDVPKVGDTVMVGYTAGEESRPVISGYAATTTDRPPLGKSGMSRNQYDSAPSPMGEGDVFTTEYVSYDDDPADKNKTELTPEEVFIQIAKRTDTEPDPTQEGTLPAKVEFYDSPATGEAHITIEIDGPGAIWGMKFNIATEEWQIVGPNGFGIESDGVGNFTWHHKDITFNEISGPSGPLSL